MQLHTVCSDFAGVAVAVRCEGIRSQFSKHPLNCFWGQWVRACECGIRFFRPRAVWGGVWVAFRVFGWGGVAGRVHGVAWGRLGIRVIQYTIAGLFAAAHAKLARGAWWAYGNRSCFWYVRFKIRSLGEKHLAVGTVLGVRHRFKLQ